MKNISTHLKSSHIHLVDTFSGLDPCSEDLSALLKTLKALAKNFRGPAEEDSTCQGLAKKVSTLAERVSHYRGLAEGPRRPAEESGARQVPAEECRSSRGILEGPHEDPADDQERLALDPAPRTLREDLANAPRVPAKAQREDSKTQLEGPSLTRFSKVPAETQRAPSGQRLSPAHGLDAPSKFPSPSYVRDLEIEKGMRFPNATHALLGNNGHLSHGQLRFPNPTWKSTRIPINQEICMLAPNLEILVPNLETRTTRLQDLESSNISRSP